MTEQRQPGRSVPLRVRFRPITEQGEQAQWDNGHAHTAALRSTGDEQLAPSPATSPLPAVRQTPVPLPSTAHAPLSARPAVPYSNDVEALRRARQTRELIRLGNMLRAELGLNEVLQQVVSAISSCTGFRASVISMLDEDGEHLSSVAFAGVSEEGQRVLREAHDPVDRKSDV